MVRSENFEKPHFPQKAKMKTKRETRKRIRGFRGCAADKMAPEPKDSKYIIVILPVLFEK